jgi:aminoglycoside phosphotransferase (APT) family kinase protein
VTSLDDAQILEQLHAFLSTQLGDSSPQITGVTKASLGRSRENWLFDAVWKDDLQEAREPLIVRRDPPGGLVETERATEFQLLRALERSPIPTPRARWLDATGAWLGRPSLIMTRETGASDYFVLNGDRPLEVRVSLAKQFCDLLAEVHKVDWRGLGIGEFLEDPGTWASRAELDRFEQILHDDQLEGYPELELAIGWLRANAPPSQATVLVHADFKPGNVLLEGAHVEALLDWELAHLGDPMEDVGWVTQPLREREHLIPGAWERPQLLERYHLRTGFDVDPASLRWWNVFATFKTAVMQVSGLRSYLEGRSEEPYRPTAKVLATLIDSIGE